MRKVIGIGETIFDIIFKNEQPTAAVPGGSTFNGLISLGRMGQDVTMITETGNDRVGRTIKAFMEENGVNSQHVCMYEDGRTAISLAYLNDRNDAEYTFYKDYPKARLDVEWPEVHRDDIVMMGSYFVLNPVLRTKVKEFLEYATKRGALVYYDINFRSSHASEAIKLYSTILENFDYASIVRGSTEDFQNMFRLSDSETVYKQEVAYHCKQMLCTDAEGDINLFSPSVTKTYKVNKIETVSTIGAGDNFNAGIVYGLLQEGIGGDDLATISEEQWNRIIAHGTAFAAEVCQSFNNSISKEFAKNYGKS
ncbi:MAG: carbohydrate kinase [Bacteroidaceae bacterium]|nr:carbohydrate kinase [Bacteroidaceae bacterium]MDE5998736.1 carbohydrate kinase [Bacteroidaceae bacterium]MDE6721136.1 carbohydrate kinase [Bacteroidaceae bacterium]